MVLNRKSEKPMTHRQKKIVLAICMVVLILLCFVVSADIPASVPTMGLGTDASVSGDAGVPVSNDSALASLSFSEIMSANRSAVPDDYGEFSDWIELVNEGSTPVSLLNVGLSDVASSVKFLFPDMTLEAGERVVVYASGKSSATPDSLHAPFKISSAGETLYLLDNRGAVLKQLDVPALDQNTVYANVNGEWTVSDRYTPGFPNTDAGYEAYRAAGTVENSVVLNEIMASNRSVLKDEDGEYVDWIELHNRGGSRIALSGFGLSDDETQRMKWQFPKGTVIEPYGYLVVFASGKNRDGTNGQGLHTNFSINATKETIVLSNARGQLLDRVVVEGLDKDQSLARHAGTGVWQIQSQATPGFSNDRDGAAALDARLRSVNHMGLFISEVVTFSSGMDTPHGRTSYDWIEIVNLNQFPINLKDYGLSDNPGRPRKWQFPDVTIQSGEYLLVFASGLAQAPKGSTALHATFRLSALGQTLVLSDPQGQILDRMVVPQLEPDTSYGRNIGQTGFYYYDVPSPGAANFGGFIGYADEPTVDLAGGMYDRAVTVSLQAPDGVTIRYTLDGSDPTEASEVYAEPLTLSKTTVLRARGFAGGLRPSTILTNTYFVSVYHALPVISLVTDPWNLWNEETGMYAGTYQESSRTRPAFKDLPYWQKNTYGGSFEFYEADGTRACVAGVELGLHGQYSLDIPQKSFRVTAKARYGSSSLDYAFFEDRPYDSYQSLVIRNGGNDGKYTRFVDGFQSRIVDWVEDTTVYHMPWRPVIVYLNGEYWGHYNIRERVNVHALARHEGWDDPDNIDLIKGNNAVLNGSYDNYRELLAYVKAHDLNDPEALKTVLDWIDVDNYFDYMIFEMYFGNTDTGNIKFYRRRAPGEKWKWVLFDLDWGLFDSGTDGCKVVLNPKGTGVNSGFDNTIIRKLLEVPEMRDKFLTRYGQLYQNVFQTERMLALMNDMAGEIQPELPMHFSRWAYDNTPVLDIEAPASPEGAYSYWQSRVYTRMARILKRRNNLVWGHVQNWFSLSDAQMITYFGERPPIPEDAQ